MASRSVRRAVEAWPPRLRLRPMDLVDDIAVHELSVKTFEELAERMDVPLSPPPRIGPALPHIRHIVGTDPGGAWIPEHGGA